MNRMAKQLSLSLLFVLPAAIHAQTGGNLSNCKGGCEMGEVCIGNAFSQPVSDKECNTCAGGRYWWPCNFETLCYCNSVEENAPRVPPAPKSGVKVNENEELKNPCEKILTIDVFNAIVQPGTQAGAELYTYLGLCAQPSCNIIRIMMKSLQQWEVKIRFAPSLLPF